MPYLVGDLLKEIAAGGPVRSCPDSSKGPPSQEKEEQEAIALEEKKPKASQQSQATKPQQQGQEDWVKEKWKWYYDSNKLGKLKPNLGKMTIPQFEQYMKDAMAQGRQRVAAATRRTEAREYPVAQQKLHRKQSVKTEVTPAATDGSRKCKAVASAAQTQSASVNHEARPREKPRVKAHMTKEEYLKKY